MYLNTSRYFRYFSTRYPGLYCLSPTSHDDEEANDKHKEKKTGWKKRRKDKDSIDEGKENNGRGSASEGPSSCVTGNIPPTVTYAVEEGIFVGYDSEY